MNKVVINELKDRHISVSIIIYAIYALVGFILLGICKYCIYDALEYTFAIFFALAFFTLISYFINRRPIDYELLFLGYIDVAVGSFALSIRLFSDTGFILADAVLMFAILTILNKLYGCKLLIEKRDLSFFPKIAVTMLLFFIGLLVVSLFHDELEVGILILGYYLAVFGLLSLLEPLTKIVCGNKSLQNYAFDMLSYGTTKKEKEPSVTLKEIKNSKPVVKKKRVVKKETTKKKTKTVKKTTK